MNRINELFQRKKDNVLSIFFTAGHPNLNDTATIIKELETNGADLIEIGIPFSDPLADGPIIQQSSGIALKNGMNLNLLFNQIKDISSEVKIPLILMGYLNPIMQYGIENFCKKCSESGIDGVIIPDLPLKEYLEEYKNTFEKYGLLNICLVTPQTSEERIQLIDKNTEGFIYIVSSSSTTGADKNSSNNQQEYFARVKAMNLKNPTLIGFGISDKKSFENACKYASGAIIGSAFINALNNGKDIPATIRNFIKSIR